MADGGRVPPSDLDAEAAVLSSCLLSRDALDDVRQIITPASFYADANRRIFEAILELDQQGKAQDIVLVAGLLRDRGHLQQIGGTPYLAQLSDATPAVANVAQHAKIIADKARQRAVISSCQRFAAEGFDDVGDVTKWAQDAAQSLADVAATGEEEDPAEFFREIIPREFKAIRDRAARNVEISGLDTGLELLNKQTCGLAFGKMHVIGARPGMGKTSVALQIAINAAANGDGVLFISAEMDKEELARKALALDARVDHNKVKSGVMRHEDWKAVAESTKYLAGLPLILKYRPGATMGTIRATVRKAARDLAAQGKTLRLVVVDYLQLLDGTDLIARGEKREREVSALSQRLTWLAGEFRVALIALSQLNRAVESRADKQRRPTMSDLRESGAIEQDAYTIGLLYREEYYNRDTEDKGILEIILDKNRGGPTCTVRVKFTAEFGRTDNLAGDYFTGANEEQPDA